MFSIAAATVAGSSNESARPSFAEDRGNWEEGNVKGVDETVARAFNATMKANLAGNAICSYSQVFKMQIDFIDKLTPEQIESTSTEVLGDDQKAISWKEYRVKAEAMFGLLSKSESFEASGTQVVLPGDPGWDQAPASTREYAGVDVLTRNLILNKAGAIEAAQHYLRGYETSREAVTSFAATVAIMAQRASDFRASGIGRASNARGAAHAPRNSAASPVASRSNDSVPAF